MVTRRPLDLSPSPMLVLLYGSLPFANHVPDAETSFGPSTYQPHSYPQILAIGILSSNNTFPKPSSATLYHPDLQYHFF
jgi:hypothetical protein